MLNIFPIPALRDNYIWALHDQLHAVIVDPGEATPVISWLDAHHIRLTAILCTHHHHDHTGGICQLVEVYNVPVYGPQHEMIPCVSVQVSEGDKINLSKPDICLKVLDIPGHTRGHVAYLTAEKENEPGNLFCGDTLFGCGCGRLFEGTPTQLNQSLQRLAQLDANTKVYCTHEYTEANIRFALVCEPGNAKLILRAAEAQQQGEAGHPTLPSSIALEKATNPFLRCTEPEIINTLLQHGLKNTDEISVFTALREWKNHF